MAHTDYVFLLLYRRRKKFCNGATSPDICRLEQTPLRAHGLQTHQVEILSLTRYESLQNSTNSMLIKFQQAFDSSRTYINVCRITHN